MRTLGFFIILVIVCLKGFMIGWEAEQLALWHFAGDAG